MAGNDLASWLVRNSFPCLFRRSIVVTSDAVEMYAGCELLMSLGSVDFVGYYLAYDELYRVIVVASVPLIVSSRVVGFFYRLLLDNRGLFRARVVRRLTFGVPRLFWWQMVAS